ncbi:MAG: lysoplasmalogenase [Flavobacteriaceae bacterium]|nr:lysoplasmalogenase [Flavobacteriaceae bacterium]
MKRKSSLIKFLTVLFFLIGALDILMLILKELPLRFITKPLIVFSLAFLYLATVKKANKIYLVALFFTIFTDILLLFKGSNYFLLGLVTLSMTHLSYIVIVKKDLGSCQLNKLLISAIPFMIAILSVIFIIHTNLGSLLVPVIVYGFIMIVLGSLSFCNYLKKRDKSSLFLVLGIFLFVSSAGIVAIERFVLPHRELELGVIIMSTYIISQFLIYSYMIQESKN